MGGVEFKWRWRRALFQWEELQLVELQGMVLNAGIKGEGNDRWIWLKDSNGSYTARSAYNWLYKSENSTSDPFYKQLWRCVAPLKVKAFAWKLVQDRIPSMLNLARRGIPLESVLCKGCENKSEYADHLFFQCEKFAAVWYGILKWWGIFGSFQGDCKSHFFQFSGLIGGSAKQIGLWNMVWLATIWVIWSTRNACIFKGKEVQVGELLEQVKLKSWLWITAKDNKFKYPLASWYSNPRVCLDLSWGPLS